MMAMVEITAETKEKIYCFESDPGVYEDATESLTLHPAYTDLCEYLRLMQVAKEFLEARPELLKLVYLTAECVPPMSRLGGSVKHLLTPRSQSEK
jgi:hypothetical protein